MPGTLPFATIGPLHYVISATCSLEGNEKKKKKKEKKGKEKGERAASGPMQTSEVGRLPKVSSSSESWETLLSKGFSIRFIDIPQHFSFILRNNFPIIFQRNEFLLPSFLFNLKSTHSKLLNISVYNCMNLVLIEMKNSL